MLFNLVSQHRVWQESSVGRASDRKPGTGLTQVRFLGTTRDFSPSKLVSKHVAFCPQKWDGLLGGRWGRGEGERANGSTVCSDPERLRPRTTARTTAMLRQWRPHRCAATSILHNCCFNCCVEQSHKDDVHSTAVEFSPRVSFQCIFSNCVCPSLVFYSIHQYLCAC